MKKKDHKYGLKVRLNEAGTKVWKKYRGLISTYSYIIIGKDLKDDDGCDIEWYDVNDKMIDQTGVYYEHIDPFFDLDETINNLNKIEQKFKTK